jgi:uncharacterized membrane protein (UPF0182 family)
MRNWKAWLGGFAVLSIILYVAFYFIFINFFVDLWWFRSLELEGYFWLKLLYRFFFSGGVTLLFFSIFFFHFWIASRYLGLNPPDDVLFNPDKRRKFQAFADVFMNGSTKFYTPLSLFLGVIIAIPFYNQWQTALLYFFGESSGVTEPVFGNDVSFYMFSYPMYQLIQKELLIAAVLLFLLVGGLYWFEHKFVPNQSNEYPMGAKVHLAVLLGFIVLFVAWGFGLERFSLLYIDSHQPVFYGPGFVDLRYELPLIWIAIFTFFAIAVLLLFLIFSEKHQGKWPLLLTIGFFGLVWGLRHVDIIPYLMRELIVKPNPVTVEKSFMQNNITATYDAYDFKNIKVIDQPINVNAAKDIENWSSQHLFENIPVWDREYLIDGYRQLQGIRPYYSFPTVDEDRYLLNGHLQQVNLAAREMNISQLPQEAQNWENKHLRYTHGYGAVITPAAQDAAKPITWYLRDLNMSSTVDFSVARSDIYFGQEEYKYAVVPNKLNVEGLSASGGAEDGQYKGKDGIPIPSYFRKLLFTAYFGDQKIFFSANISTQSKILIRRNIIERVSTVTPFLHLDKDPYLVVTKDRFYWMLDAYTLSDKYPVSAPTKAKFFSSEQEFNYIRNSVKITVDAYDGTVKYYISNPNDPIIQAYSRAYPGLFKKLSEMPVELQAHLRYPRDLYYLQMKVFAKYHQNTPELFYEQAETWQFSSVESKLVMPYYMTMGFGNCGNQEEFVLITPMTPINRSNLSMVGVASTLDKTQCSGSYNPQITVYKFPKEVQVNGPAQVDALIDQNPEISEQITLWDQHGSKVIRGRMVILLMGKSILYVQPIYMTSEQTKMPELARVIVSIGNHVVMDTTLRSAFKRLKVQFIQQAKDIKSSGTAQH